MRPFHAPGALAFVLTLTLAAASPAAAQVQLGNPNAANSSFALQSQFRSQQLQSTSEFNTLNMQAQRNVQFAPSTQGFPGAYGIVGRSRHRAVGRVTRGTGHRGFDMGICTGC
ncbi:hypothetical protein [Methylobacterium aerolatum]|uniref:Uncharacterized protein n=1 Tax=Methylobacterium aerolatum TaxID=418708 RepID=A0ABU0I1T5_9HYPH|nr:hypothetical protein [Methylobacterium aerolatum]MDQ0448564.1 hypothetical protein [Methylobacterium aerolatum]GJD33181.1 hypothetical protein FMGBMHLM_0066 [Methylobacterium aerolatum]